MDTNETAFLSLIVMAVVAIFALFILKERIKRIIIKPFGGIVDVQASPPERKGSNEPPSKIRPKKISADLSNSAMPPAQPPTPPPAMTRS